MYSRPERISAAKNTASCIFKIPKKIIKLIKIVKFYQNNLIKMEKFLNILYKK